MKKWTISRRIKFLLGVIIALIVLNDVLSWWVNVRMDATAKQIADQQHTMLAMTNQMRRDISRMGEGLTLLLLDPKSDFGKKYKQDADDDILKVGGEFEALAREEPEVNAALKALHNYDDTILNPTEDKVVEMAANDPGTAGKFYA